MTTLFDRAILGVAKRFVKVRSRVYRFVDKLKARIVPIPVQTCTQSQFESMTSWYPEYMRGYRSQGEPIERPLYVQDFWNFGPGNKETDPRWSAMDTLDKTNIDEPIYCVCFRGTHHCVIARRAAIGEPYEMLEMTHDCLNTKQGDHFIQGYKRVVHGQTVEGCDFDVGAELGAY